jgi:hypothetical protein
LNCSLAFGVLVNFWAVRFNRSLVIGVVLNLWIVICHCAALLLSYACVLGRLSDLCYALAPTFILLFRDKFALFLVTFTHVQFAGSTVWSCQHWKHKAHTKKK